MLISLFALEENEEKNYLGKRNNWQYPDVKVEEWISVSGAFLRQTIHIQ